MKKTPLPLRIIGGLLLGVLFLLCAFHPMLTQGECVSLIALSHKGKPYVFGAEGPNSYDCSGLTMDACAYFGVDLIHSAQFVASDSVYTRVEEIASLRPGDLVFFDTVADRDPYDHVGVWLGMNRFVHASSSEGRVMISWFGSKWRGCYSGARRIVENYDLTALTQAKDLISEKYGALLEKLVSPSEK